MLRIKKENRDDHQGSSSVSSSGRDFMNKGIEWNSLSFSSKVALGRGCGPI
jgi:hypothetical protein